MEWLMAILTFLLCGFVMIFGAGKVLLAWSMRQWPTAQGEVRSSSVLPVHSGTDRMYRPEILYAFTVGGIEYTGVRRTLFPIQTGGTGYAEKIVAQYPVGQRVTVYYDPRNPRESVLNRGSALPMAAVVTAFATYMSAAMMLWFARHRG